MNDPNQTHRARQVGPYRLLRQIGVGAMGEIYLVQHVETDERFALKRIRGDFVDEEELIRFRREAELVARVYHPHVVRLRDSNFATAQPYQVYDLYEGGTLQDRIQRAGSMTLEDTLEIVGKLASALSHAHSQGVLHRDLKPENVLFNAAGEPALADFGLARKSQAQSRGLTATGEAIGTPLYMAPEQVLDSKRVDERADLYGLAAITYAMLSGGPPVVGSNTVLEAFDKVLNERPPPLGRSDVPPGVERALFSGLEKSPEDRPASVSLWHASLEGGARAGFSGARLGLVSGLLALVASLLVALAIGVALWDSGEQASASRGAPQASSPSGSPSPTPLPAIGETGAVDLISLRKLVQQRSGWAWLTLSQPEGPRVSLLVTCTWGRDQLSIEFTRGRGVEGEIWDSTFDSGERLTGLIRRGRYAVYSERGEVIEEVKLPRGVPLKGPAGELLRPYLEPGAMAAVLRLLAKAEADDHGVRRADWGGDGFVWEPLIWAEWPNRSRGASEKVLKEPPLAIRRLLLETFRLERSEVDRAMSPQAWAGALTHNYCRDLDTHPWPANEHFALPYGVAQLSPLLLGAARISGGQLVHSQPGGLLIGITPAAETRYLVFGQRKGWLRISWGGGKGWVRGQEFDKQAGRMVRVILNSVNVRMRPYFPGDDYGHLGANPVVGQVPQGALYPFLGVVTGPPKFVELDPRKRTAKGKPGPKERWALIQFDDRQVWAARWTYNSETKKRVSLVRTDTQDRFFPGGGK